MTRAGHLLAASGCIVSVLLALPGCSSSVGTGDKKADEVTFKGSGNMPPEAAAKMQAAMAHAGNKASAPHGPAGAAGGAPGGAQAGQAGAQNAIDAARNKAMQSQGGN